MATKAFSLFGVFMALALLATLVVSVLPGRNNNTASAAVSALAIAQSTFNPGASPRVTATFTTNAVLATNAGTVTLTFPAGYTVAPTRAQIFISDRTIAVPVNPAIDPAIVGRAVKITIPDMNPATPLVNDSLSVGAGHTVLITGGIINPSSAGTKAYTMESSQQGSRRRGHGRDCRSNENDLESNSWGEGHFGNGQRLRLLGRHSHGVPGPGWRRRIRRD